MEQNNSKEKSPYRRGADNGVWMGLWMSVMFGLWSYTLYDPTPSGWLSIPALAMMMGVPLLLYFMLRRTYLAVGPIRGSLSALWMEGIMTFIFGALIALIAGYVFMRFIEPSFLSDLYARMLESLDMAAEATSGAESEQYKQIAKNFSDMIGRGEAPAPLSLLLDIMWFVTFSGCVLSLVVAGIVRAVKIRVKKQI